MTEQQPPIDTESRWACRCSQDSPDGIRLLWDAPQRRGFQNLDGRYIVTFDGSIDGNLIQIAILVTENSARKAESIRLFARPWPVVKLFRQFMERNLRPDPVPDAIWNLPATNA